jgi:hypothetical protein
MSSPSLKCQAARGRITTFYSTSGPGALADPRLLGADAALGGATNDAEYAGIAGPRW